MIKRIFFLYITTKMVVHLNQPEIQFIGILEFVSDEYLCYHTSSQNILIKLYIFKMLKFMIKRIFYLFITTKMVLHLN
jgi:hypothetical protein